MQLLSVQNSCLLFNQLLKIKIKRDHASSLLFFLVNSVVSYFLKLAFLLLVSVVSCVSYLFFQILFSKFQLQFDPGVQFTQCFSSTRPACCTVTLPVTATSLPCAEVAWTDRYGGSTGWFIILTNFCRCVDQAIRNGTF